MWEREFLGGAVGPVNLVLFDFGCGAEAEMDRGIRTGGVAAAAEEVGALADSSGGEEHLCADGIARTLRAADQLQREPVIAVLDDIAKKRGGRVDVVKDDVHEAVVE